MTSSLMPSKKFTEYFLGNPFIAAPEWQKQYTNHKMLGDDLPEPPIRFGRLFRELAEERRQSFFSQSEFVEYCVIRLSSFYKSLDITKQITFGCKLAYNFYPAFMDEWHVQCLLTEHGFEVEYEPEMDVQKNVDLTVRRDGLAYDIALFIDTPASRFTIERKQRKNPNVIYIGLPISRERIGGKRWYELRDFKPLGDAIRRKRGAMLNAPSAV